MSLLLAPSDHLVPVPAINLAEAVVLDDDCPFASWEAMFTQHAGKLHYLLKPGNYEHWGPLKIPHTVSPSDDRPKTVRYYAPGVDDMRHPVNRSRAARIASFRLEGTDTRNWFIRGLTVTRPGADCAIQNGACHVTVDFCLIEYPRVRGCRIRDVSHCTIQRCVIRETVSPGRRDPIGIQVRQRLADEMVEINLLDNEIYNVGDGIQLTAHDVDPLRPVEVVIEGNDIYLEPSRYIGNGNLTWAENAIDIKVGSCRPESTIVRNNRMWGYRRRLGPGAQGELLVVQKFCRNLVIEGNIMGDAPRGMKDERWPDDDDDPPINAQKSRNVVCRNNQFYEIRDRAVCDRGAITKPITTGILFEDNLFARSDFVADSTPTTYEGDPEYRGNVRIGSTQIQRPNFYDKNGVSRPNKADVPYHEPPNRRIVARLGYETYERKRWTGPEAVDGAIPATGPATHSPPGDAGIQRP